MISAKSVRDLIVELNQADESEGLEAKAATDAVGRSVLETICALSNEPQLGGGTILLGVSREEGSLFPLFAVTGVDAPDKILTDLATQAASIFNVPIRIDATREIINRRCVIRIDVPELSPTQKPLYFKAQGLPRGAFRRIGSTDQRCTEDDLFAFFQTRGSDAPDTFVVEGAS